MVFFKLYFHLNKIYAEIKDYRAVEDAFHITNHQFDSIILQKLKYIFVRTTHFILNF